MFKALLEHVFAEKIEHSTVKSLNNNFKKSVEAETNTQKLELIVIEEKEGKLEVKNQSATQIPSP